MEQLPALALIGIAAVGLVAVLFIARRAREEAAEPESPFAASTEGEKICPNCRMGNLWTDSTCVACGKPLPG
jgi:hypothetical protein